MAIENLDEHLKQQRQRRVLQFYREEFMKALRGLGAVLTRLKNDSERPWAADYSSFEECIQKEFGISPRRGYQLMAGEITRDETLALVPAEMKPVVQSLNDRQIAEISKVPRVERVAVLSKAAEAPKITAAVIKAAAKNEPPPTRKPRKPMVIDGDTGRPVEPQPLCPHCGRPMP